MKSIFPNFYLGDTTKAERNLSFLCDNFELEQENQILYRAITINSSPTLIFRWLLQMKIAPYSYDLIDNLGKKSPEKLTPGLENLSLGDSFMYIFRLSDFSKNQEICIHLKESRFTNFFFGKGIISYKIVPLISSEISEKTKISHCRLIAKLKISHSQPLIIIRKIFLAIGDYMMMQQQLKNFKRLAERQAILNDDQESARQE